jgi:hypothetical protein
LFPPENLVGQSGPVEETIAFDSDRYFDDARVGVNAQSAALPPHPSNRVPEPAFAERDQFLRNFEQLVAQLERRAFDACASLELRLTDFQAQTQIGLQTLTELQAGAAGTTQDLGRRLSDLDARTNDIDRAITEMKGLENALSALQVRMIQLSERERLLEDTERVVTRLDERADAARTALARDLHEFESKQATIEHEMAQVNRTADQLAAFEDRIADFHAQRQGIEEAGSVLQARAAETTRTLEGRLSDLDLKTRDIERASIDARNLADALSTLHEQMSQTFERLQHTIPQLEERASQASESLEQHVSAGEAKRAAFHKALLDAKHAADVLSGLENRVAHLTSGGALDGVEHKVRRLEQRASAAATELKRVTKARNDLEHELAHLQADVKKTAEAGRHEAKQLADLRAVTQRDASKTAATSQRAALVNAVGAVASGWRRGGDYGQGIPEGASDAGTRFSRNSNWFTGGAVYVAVSGAAFLLAFIALRSLGHLSTTYVRSSPTATAPLESRALSYPLLQAPPATSAPIESVRRTPAQVQATTNPARGESVATDAAAQPFIGSLTVDSEPDGATVFLNQQSVGQTPLRLTDLKAGSYVIRLERSGYRRWTSSVLISSIRPTHMTVALEQDTAR